MNETKATTYLTDIKEAIEELGKAYAYCIDDNKLEEWPEFFTDDCLYQIISHENYSRNLPISIIYCNSRNMLKDRITSHRHANVYEPHKFTHILSGTQILGKEGDTYSVRSNYAVFQTRDDGITEVYNTGKYLDKVVFIEGMPKYKERKVVYDTAMIPTLLVTPI